MSERLILHHTYDNGVAFDISEHGNHGELLGGVAPAAAYSGSMHFLADDHYIRVRPSKTVTDLRTVRVRVRFMWTPVVDPADWLMNPFQRHMLAWGDGSFAFAVGASGGFGAVLYDSIGQGIGTGSPPGLITPNQWVEAEFHHDGVNRLRLWLDGTLVGEQFDVDGPVRPVRSGGVAIGHLPDPDDPDSFQGYIDDVKIWGYDPEPDVRDFFDVCCLDRAGLDDLLHKMRAAGWDAERAGDLVREVFDLATEMSVAMRGGDPARTTALEQLTRDGMLAVMRKDLPALADTFDRVQGAMLGTLSEAEIVDYGARALDQVARSPFGDVVFDGGAPDLDAARELAAILCLDRLMPAETRDTHPGDRPRRPDGDRDTDGPDGKPPDDWDTGRDPSPPDEPGRPNDEAHDNEDDDR